MIRKTVFLVVCQLTSFFSYSQDEVKLDAVFLHNQPVWKIVRNLQGHWCWGGADSTKIWLIDQEDQVHDYSASFGQLTTKKFTDLFEYSEAIYLGTDGDYVLKYANGVMSTIKNGLGSGRIEKISSNDEYELCVRTSSDTYVSSDFVNFSTSNLKRIIRISDFLSSTVYSWDSTAANLCGKYGNLVNFRSKNFRWSNEWKRSLVMDPGDKVNSAFIPSYSDLDTVNIYAGLNSGLYLLKYECETQRYLNDTAIYHISAIRQGEVVACTDQGLVYIDVKDGIQNNKILVKDIKVYSIAHKLSNYFWLGTNGGVKRYKAYQYKRSVRKEYACPEKPVTVWAPSFSSYPHQHWLKDDVKIEGHISRDITFYTPGVYKAISYYGPASTIMDTTVYEVSPYPMDEVTLTYPDGGKFCKDSQYRISLTTKKCYECTVAWYRDGVRLPNRTNYLDTTLPGLYLAEVTDCNGTQKFAEAKMEIISEDEVHIIASSSDISCAKEAITLKSSPTLGAVSWFLNDRYYSSDPEIKVNLPGTWVLRSRYFCSLKHDTIEVRFHDLPFAYIELEDEVFVAKTSLFEGGQQVFFSEVTAYQWYFNDKKIQGVTDSFFKPTQFGAYKVELFNARGCSNFSQTFIYDVTSNESDLKSGNMDVYPNPSNGEFNIYLSKGQGEGEYEVYDSKGALVKKGRLAHFDKLSLSESGIFFLLVKQGNSVFTKKLIKSE